MSVGKLRETVTDASNKRKWKIRLLTVGGLNEGFNSLSRVISFVLSYLFLLSSTRVPVFSSVVTLVRRMRWTRGRTVLRKDKKTANDTMLHESKWEMCEIIDYYDLARMRNGYLYAVVIITKTHDSVYRVHFMRLARARDK